MGRPSTFKSSLAESLLSYNWVSSLRARSRESNSIYHLPLKGVAAVSQRPIGFAAHVDAGSPFFETASFSSSVGTADSGVLCHTWAQDVRCDFCLHCHDGDRVHEHKSRDAERRIGCIVRRLHLCCFLCADRSIRVRKARLHRASLRKSWPVRGHISTSAFPANVRKVRLEVWRFINHDSFDGKFIDSLTNTSLHLSFTNYEMPLNVGPRALCDTLAVLVESLVSIMTGANISVIWTYLSMFANKRLEIVWCEHCQSEASDEMTQFKGQSEVISIGSWAELFDFPMRASIVRAYGN